MVGQQTDEKIKSGNTFLTPQEQIVCEQVSKGKSPFNQQALTLLALHEGNTQLQASEKGGLTPGQVKYLAAKFRRQRLNIFPGELLSELDISIEKPQTDLSTNPANLAKVKKKISESGKGKSKMEKGKKKDKKAKKDKKRKKKKSKKKDNTVTKDSKDKKKKTNKKLEKKPK